MWSHPAVRIGLAACALFVIATAVTLILLWHKSKPSDHVAGEQLHPSDDTLRSSTDRSDATGTATRGANLGNAAVRFPS